MASRAESIGKWVGRHLLFNDALESDRREPIATFSVGGDEYGFLAPQIEFWIGLVATLLICFAFNACMACIMYQFIVLPRKRASKGKAGEQRPGSSTSPYLVGFGIVMPICLVSPYYGLRLFGVKNKIIKFLVGIEAVFSFFRCSEAMFGFLPPFVDESLSNLIIYSALPVEIKFSKNGPMRSTWTHVGTIFVKWIKYMLILGAYASLLLNWGAPNQYQLYPNPEGPALADVSLLSGFSQRQLINNLSVAIMFQVYLTTFGSGMTFLVSLLGAQQVPMMLNPIFESTSPSDFWGRKWNLVVHGILKRGVYKPVRTRYSRLMASVATFITSGLWHEWLLSVVFYPDSEDGKCSPICYTPGFGRNTLFFFWNSVLIGLEYAIGSAAIFQMLRKHLPLTVTSLMVASLALPVAHWFTNDYVRSDFFDDGHIGFPMIVRLSE